MTIFDLVAGLVLLASAMIGFARGAVRELIGFFSFLIAALAAIWLLPFATPLAARFFHVRWMAIAGAIVVVFVVTFVVLRLIGNAMTGGLQRSGLRGANQAGGLIVGVLRGLLTLGTVAILVGLLPQTLQPGWILNARLWPISRYSGQLIAKLIPQNGDLTGGLGPMLKNAVDKANTGTEDATPNASPAPADNATADAPPPPPPPVHHGRRSAGYGEHDRRSLDSLVDRAR